MVGEVCQRNPAQPRLVPDDIAVVGVADDPDFVAGSDIVTYRIQLPADTSGVSIAVDLNYQSLTYGFLRDLPQDAADPMVGALPR